MNHRCFFFFIVFAVDGFLCLSAGGALHVTVSVRKCSMCHIICRPPEKSWDHLPRDFGSGMGNLGKPGPHTPFLLPDHPCLPRIMYLRPVPVSVLYQPVNSQQSHQHLTAYRQEVLSLFTHSSSLGPCWAFQVESRPEKPRPRPVAIGQAQVAGMTPAATTGVGAWTCVVLPCPVMGWMRNEW